MMNDKPQVLLVEDESEVLADLLWNLRGDEYDLTGVRSLEEAIAALAEKSFDVVVTDLRLFSQPDGGMKVIERAKALDATTGVFVVTGVGGESDAYRAIRELGAREFFLKPLDYAVCRRRVREAIQERRRRLRAIEAAARGVFEPIPNPYMAGKPLNRSSEMFYGRDEAFDFIRNNIGAPPHHNHLALIGPRRIGKTSILQQLPAQLSSLHLPAYINCQALGIDPGMAAFFLQLSRQIHRSLQAQGVDVSGLPLLAEADLGRTPSQAFTHTFLPLLRQTLGSRSLVLCLDEFEELESKVQRGRLDAAVFEFLCELMQTENQIACVLAGTRRLEELSVTGKPIALLLDMVIYWRVGVLPPEQARRLIAEPVEYSGMYYQEEAIGRLQGATGGYPYLIQLLCGKLVNRRNAQRRNEMTFDDVDASVAAVVEGPQPGFFWGALSPHQQAVLVAACQLAQNREPITHHDIKAQLEAFAPSYQGWSKSVLHLLHELALQELLREKIVGSQTPRYTLAFGLLSDWVRRHKSMDQVREVLGREE